MDISSVGMPAASRTCGRVPCAQCEPCRRRAMLIAASYALRMETQEEGAPGAALLDLLDKLGLPG